MEIEEYTTVYDSPYMLLFLSGDKLTTISRMELPKPYSI